MRRLCRVAKWVENPYWQYLCGCETFHHELPCHPTSLVKWRQRIGVSGMEALLKSVLQAALKVQALPEADLKQVTVDTTVQEKAIAFPTDARLYHKARRTWVRVAKAAGVTPALAGGARELRQWFEWARRWFGLDAMMGRGEPIPLGPQ
jgi:hypothetical protein